MKIKIYKRRFMNEGWLSLNEGYFILTGSFSNGRNAYSRIDPKTQMILDPEDESMYMQVTFRGHLIMEHI